MAFDPAELAAALGGLLSIRFGEEVTAVDVGTGGTVTTLAAA